MEIAITNGKEKERIKPLNVINVSGGLMSIPKKTYSDNREKGTYVLESVVIRLYDVKDYPKVIAAFQQVRQQFSETDARLLKNDILEGDWHILIRRMGSNRNRSKSPESTILKEMLCEVGMVYIASWHPVITKKEEI